MSTYIIKNYDKAISQVQTDLADNVSQLSDLETNKADKTEINALATAKADKIYVDSNISTLDMKINSQASGSPKDVYATLSDLQTAFPVGNTNIYVVSVDGNWYYWNGTAWVSGGVYQSSGIARKSVTEEMLTKSYLPMQKSKNLFDKNTALNGYYINAGSGNVAVNANYYASDWIEVNGNTTYTLTKKDQIAFYDSNKTFISGDNSVSSSPPFTFTTPANAYYIRLTIVNTNINTCQLELGNTGTTYENYNINYLLSSAVVDNINLKDDNIDIKKIKNNKNIIQGVDSKNLFDKTTVTSGYYVLWGSGGLNINASYSASDYIPIKSSTNYAINFSQQYAFFDVNKSYISGNSVSTNAQTTFISPSNAVFMKVTVANANLSNYQIEEGTVSTSYVTHDMTIPVSYLPNTTYTSVQSIMQSVITTTGKKIKLIGDSITAGVGGTGYAMTGELIISGWNVNVNGHCWANTLKQYLEAKFGCTVKNYGTSGRASSWMLSNIGTLVKSDDDIVICMIGTNDRNTSSATSKTVYYNNLVSIGNAVKNMGKNIIFMSSIPASVSNETDTGNPKDYHMEDIDSLVMSASAYLNTEYISLYKEFMNYCDAKGVTIDSLLADGLHPNDAGYDVMFNLVCDRLGVGRKRPSATW